MTTQQKKYAIANLLSNAATMFIGGINWKTEEQYNLYNKEMDEYDQFCKEQFETTKEEYFYDEVSQWDTEKIDHFCDVFAIYI